jgi:tetratricopeptide (TPR) repeat protein
VRLLRTAAKNLAVLHTNAKHFPDGVSHAERALHWTEIAVRDRVAPRIQLAEDWINLGCSRCEAGDYSGALADIEYGIAIIRRLKSDDPERERRELIHALGQRGRTLDRLDRYEEAIAAFSESAALAEAMIRDEPGSMRGRHRLSVCLRAIGTLYVDLKLPARAIEYYRRAEALRDALARDFPQEPMFPSELAATRKRLAEALAELPPS